MYGAFVCRTVLHDSIFTLVLGPSGTYMGMKAAARLEGTDCQLVQLPGRKTGQRLHLSSQRQRSLSSVSVSLGREQSHKVPFLVAALGAAVSSAPALRNPVTL